MFNEHKWSEPQAHISSNRWFCSPGLHSPVLGVGSGPPWDGRGPPTESPPPHPAASSIQVFPGPTPAELPSLSRSRLQSISLQILNVQPLVFILHFKINILISRSIFFALKFYNTFFHWEIQSKLLNFITTQTEILTTPLWRRCWEKERERVS